MKHFAYYNQFLGEDFCHACGENWPCLSYRQANPRCACSHARVTHSKRTGDCWQTPCACGEFRPEEIAK